MGIRPFQGISPILGLRVYLDAAATVIGDVVLGDDVSIWPGTVVRGDVNFIRVGARSNIQDGSIVHVTHDGPYGKPGGLATLIGEDVTIGHGAIIHACTIEDACLIGMGSIILDGAVVRRNGFVFAEAQALLPGCVLPSFAPTTVQLLQQTLDGQLQFIPFLTQLLLSCLEARARLDQFLIHPL